MKRLLAALVATGRWSIPLILAGPIMLAVSGNVLMSLGLGVATGGVACIIMVRQAVRPVDGWGRRVPDDRGLLSLDRAIRTMADKPALSNEDYDRLVGYFAAGVRAYRNKDCSLVLYPGVPGTRGLLVEGVEGFARSAPLLAAWIASGRGRVIPTPDGHGFDALSHLLNGLSAGADRASHGYWGRIVDLDQRIVEAGDIALTVWLLHDQISHELPKGRRDAVLGWLADVAGRAIYGGNWHLFPVIVGATLQACDHPFPSELILHHYEAFKRSYVGDGWFSDAEGGRIDYYNAWQMHYFLYWIDKINPNLDPTFIRQALALFAGNFRFFIAPDGVPIFGRSLGYRMAVPAPLVLAAHSDCRDIPAGLARRALDAVWGHFIRLGALRAGTVTQGYGTACPELLENYSGRGSCLWALRSLVAAYAAPQQTGIWAATAAALPVEESSYDVTISGPGLRLIGDHTTRSVEIRPSRNEGRGWPPMRKMSLLRKVGQFALQRPLRLDNFRAKYDQECYRSDRPFCGNGPT
jgi:hypothetical protein